MVNLGIFVLSFHHNGLDFMKKKYSDAGKGDRNRISDKKRFDKNWEKIFGIDKEVRDHSLGVGFAQKDIKKKNIREFYSSEDCKIDENGGPHKIDLNKLKKNESKN